MCGVCGTYSPGIRPSAELPLRMMTALSHRGPDGSGLYLDDTVALGHTRLSIVDVAGGVQPMTGEDERVWVTFNGEIFNFVELRRELSARGHHFRTQSDTEVIVHGWEEWGPDCFRRFNGQWAMAIWDRHEQRLTLSRDRYGIHPLFYAWAGDRLVFASEIKALFCDEALPRALDPAGIDELLTFWAPVAPRTMFRGVRQVEPGTYLTVQGTQESPHRYWTPDFPPRGEEPAQDLAENAERLREAVVDATRLRFLRSDVPVGAYLSGGIDSAVTAASIAAFADTEVHTFSLRFADAEFDEGEHQRLMSRRLGTRHEDVVVSEREIAETLPTAVWHAESGLLRSAPVPMLLLSRLVHDSGYKVVVTGEGADEVLAGYDIFREAKVRQFLSRDPGSDLRARAVELLYPWLARNPNQAPSFSRSFFARNLDAGDPAMSHRPRWDSTAMIKPLLNRDLAPERPSAAVDRLIDALPGDAAGWDPLSRAQWLEITTLLSGYLLSSQGDRMLMANSVEGRFPFLDHRVFEAAATFPARQKILGLDEKHLLKRAFADLVPREVVERPKQPFRAPDASSFFSTTPPGWLADLTSPSAIAAAGIFQPQAVTGLLAKCRRAGGTGLSNTDNMRVMAVLTLQLLQELFVTNWTMPAPHPPAPLHMFDRSDQERSSR